MPLIHAQQLIGKPPCSASATRAVGSSDVMKTLFRSSGVAPAANSTSAGTVAVRPIVLESTARIAESLSAGGRHCNQTPRTPMT